MQQQLDIEKDTRIVIQPKEDDFGVLCLQVRLESKHSVHFGSRAAAIVPEDDCVVTFSLPRRGEKPTAAATTEGQQQSAARAHHARDIDEGTGRCTPKVTGPSRKYAAEAAGDSSGTGDNGSGSSSSSKSQRRRAQLRECKRLRAAHDCIGYALRLEARGSGRGRNSGGAPAAAAENRAGGQTTGAQQQQQQRRQQRDNQQKQPPAGAGEAVMARTEAQKMETEGNDAAAENAAGSQAVTRARQQQQQQQNTQLPQPQARAGETADAAIEADVAAATAAEAEALAELKAAEAQLDAAFAANAAAWSKTAAAEFQDKLEALRVQEAAQENEDAAHTRWQQAIERKEAAVARQQQQHAQVCEPAAAAATAQEEFTAAAAEDDAAAVQVAATAAESELRRQIQQLQQQLVSEEGFSSGLLNAQSGLAGATARRKQIAAATDKTETPVWAGESSRGNWKQVVQMGSKLHSGSTAKENTDSNRTGMALRWVGVRSDVHKRQQAQLAAYRNKCLQAKVWKADKFGKVWEKKKKQAAKLAAEQAAAAGSSSSRRSSRESNSSSRRSSRRSSRGSSSSRRRHCGKGRSCDRHSVSDACNKFYDGCNRQLSSLAQTETQPGSLEDSEKGTTRRD